MSSSFPQSSTSAPAPAPPSSSACQKYRYKPRKRVFVIYYSMYGHIFKMAQAIVAGLEKAGGLFIAKTLAFLFSQNKILKIILSFEYKK